MHDKRNLATSSPVTDGERVYAWFSTGQLAAIDMNGKAVWTRHLGQEYATFDLDWGHASSPALYRDRLILMCYQGSAAFLLALDKRTGKELWKVDRARDVKSYSTPLVIETAQGPEVIINSNESIEAFDPSTGKSLWKFVEPARFAVPMPVYHDGSLYVSRGYRSGPYWAMKLGERSDVPKSKLLWHVETGAPYTSSIVHHDGLIYHGNRDGDRELHRREDWGTRVAGAARRYLQRFSGSMPMARSIWSAKMAKPSCAQAGHRRYSPRTSWTCA